MSETLEDFVIEKRKNCIDLILSKVPFRTHKNRKRAALHNLLSLPPEIFLESLSRFYEAHRDLLRSRRKCIFAKLFFEEVQEAVDRDPTLAETLFQYLNAFEEAMQKINQVTP